MNVDEKSKKLLWAVLILMLLSLTFTFVKTIILGDFDIVESEPVEETEEILEEDVEAAAGGTVEAGVPIDEVFQDVPQEVLGASIELM